jgi:hypothetical protein
MLGIARSYIYISDPVGSLTFILLCAPYSDVLVQYTVATSNSFISTNLSSRITLLSKCINLIEIFWYHQQSIEYSESDKISESTGTGTPTESE